MELVFPFHNSIHLVCRFIFGEDPASQNDFYRIAIHELPSPDLDNQKVGQNGCIMHGNCSTLHHTVFSIILKCLVIRRYLSLSSP